MFVILLTGAIASGKSSIGKALADKLIAMGQATSFIDLDDEVLKIHGSFEWSNDRDRTTDWMEARRIAATRANGAIAKKHNVVVSGPFFLKDEIKGLTSHLDMRAQTFLFILESPLALRLERNRRRAGTTPDKQIIDQNDAVEALPIVYGAAIPNVEEPRATVEQLLQRMKHGVGQL